jgi:uncharacterized cupredoxin-like copper-binding protein
MRHHRMFPYLAAAGVAAVAVVLIGVGAPVASAQGRTIAVTGKITGFTPSTITVKAGEKVDIALTSPDIDHDLTIKDLGFKVVADKGATVKGALTAPSSPGKHKFICSVPGHEAAGMVGTLVVTAAGGAKAPAAKTPATKKAPGAAKTPAAAPSGGADTGGGSTAGLDNVGLLALGGGLLLAAAITGLLGRRVARRH